MLSFMVQNPVGTLLAIVTTITAWPYAKEYWNHCRRERFLRNNPSVILAPKASKRVDLWPTRLAKLVYKMASEVIWLCWQVVLALGATILRKITRWCTWKPPVKEGTKPPAAPPQKKEREQIAAASSPTAKATTVPARVAANPPTSVLKRRNPGMLRRRDSMEPRVTFTESSNGKVATSYYYYNPTQQSNQKSLAARPMDHIHQTPVAVHTTTSSRLPTPFHFEHHQLRQASKDVRGENRSITLSGFNKENMPKAPLQTHKSHSPGQKQIRAAMEPVTTALRKRRIELENLANGSEKKRRIPVGGTHSAAKLIVRPTKRRERQQLIWEQLNNKRPKKNENEQKDETVSTLQPNTSYPTVQVAPTDNVPDPSAAYIQPNATDNASPPSHGDVSSTKTTLPGAPFQAAQDSTAPAPSNFQFGVSSSAPPASQNETTRVDGFQFGSAGSSLNSKEAPAISANTSFQFGSTENKPRTETVGHTTASSIAFGATSDASGTSEAPSSSFQFGNPTQSYVGAPAPQPAFKFGSSAEITPAPGPVSNGTPFATSAQQNSQPNAAFQFGGDNATAAPSFGMPANTNFAPSFDASSFSAPSFGVTVAQAPVFGMGSPSAGTNNSARTRRLARRGRRIT